MITLLIPIVRNNFPIDTVTKIIHSSKYKNQIVVNFACHLNSNFIQQCEKIEKSFPIILDTFPQTASANAMINSCIKNLPEGDLIIVRENSTIFSTNNLDKLIDESKNFDIVMFKSNKKVSKIHNFCSKILKKLCHKFLGFSFFDGSISFQIFKQNAVNILKSVTSTTLTKINRWLGMKIKYINTSEETESKKTIPAKLIISPIIYTIIFLLTIALAIFLPKWITISFVIIMLFILIFLAESVLILFSLLKIYCFRKVGIVKEKTVNIFQRREL